MNYFRLICSIVIDFTLLLVVLVETLSGPRLVHG